MPGHELTQPRPAGPAPRIPARCVPAVASRHAVGRRACHRSQCTDGPTTRECQSQRIANTYTDHRRRARAVTARPSQRSRRARAVAHTCPAVAATLLTMVDAGAVGPWAVPASAERRARGVVYGLLRYTTRSSEYVRSDGVRGRRSVCFGFRCACQERATGASRSHVLDC